MNARRLMAVAIAALVAAGLLGGCAVYPAYPAYPAYATYPSTPVAYANATAPAPAPVVVAPAPVYLAPPPPVYYGPAWYPSVSIGIFGRFGHGGHHHR